MPSRQLSGQRHGAGPPEFLADRGLGRLALPAAFQDAGLVVHTLADVYGAAGSHDVQDVDWISLAASRDWVVLCRDDRIRRRPAERQALADGGVRAFCLMNRHLSFADRAAYFVGNRLRIIQESGNPGPFLCGVYQDRIKRLWPSESQPGR